MAGLSDVAEGALRVVPLGGLGEIGRNMMVYETADDLVVDRRRAALSLRRHARRRLHHSRRLLRRSNVVTSCAAYLITHGHEDHIGALRFLIASVAGADLRLAAGAGG